MEDPKEAKAVKREAKICDYVIVVDLTQAR